MFCYVTWLFLFIFVFANLIYVNDGNDDSGTHFYASAFGDFPSKSFCLAFNKTMRCSASYFTIDGNPNLVVKEVVDKDMFVLHEAIFFSIPLKSLKKDKILHELETNLISLVFTNTSMETIEANVFDKFVKLEILELTGNLISAVDEHVFTKNLGLTLKWLDLRYNELKNLSLNVFQHLVNLETLQLSANIDILPSSGIFPKSLNKLKELKLSSCNISTLNDDIFENLKSVFSIFIFQDRTEKICRSLEILSLAGNPLKTFPRAIIYLPNLISLSLAFSEITELKYSENTKNGNLQTINFSYSFYLESVDDCAFCNFPMLQNISFNSCTKIKNIHENAFGSLNGKPLAIKHLNLEAVFLPVLPEKLLDWKSAETLKIQGNSLSCDDCRNAWLIKELQNNYEEWNTLFSKLDYSIKDLTCKSPKFLYGKPMYTLTEIPFLRKC